MSEKMYTEVEYIKAIREAIGERAIWFYMLLKEAEKQGADVDSICSKAIYEFGRIRGEKYKDATGAGNMADMLYQSKGQKIFEMELEKNTKECGILRFNHCPLVEAWKGYNLPLEERKEFCRLACYGDYGRVSQVKQTVKLEFDKRISADDDCCKLVFTCDT